MTRITARTNGAKPGWSRRGLRGRDNSARPALPRDWACPECGQPTRDADAIRLGFCSRCRDFTGMCAAGRRIVCPDVITMTAWHSPCTNLGTVRWQVAAAGGARAVVLCLDHDAQLRSGAVPWVRNAVPLEDA